MDELSKAVQRVRQLVNREVYDQPGLVTELSGIRDQLAAVSTRLNVHNELEEEQVYEWPALMLSGSELRILEDVLKKEIENLPPRFDKKLGLLTSVN